jgi:gas vesicle protein
VPEIVAWHVVIMDGRTPSQNERKPSMRETEMRDMMNSDNRGQIVVPFLLGAAAGAVVALLFAPKTGEDLRSNIADSVSEGSRRLSAQGKDLKKRVQKAVGQVQDQTREAIDMGEDAYSRAQGA